MNARTTTAPLAAPERSGASTAPAILVFDHRFRMTDGRIASPANFDYDLFSRRYLSSFDHLEVVGRLDRDRTCPPGAAPSEGPGVTLKLLPASSLLSFLPRALVRTASTVARSSDQHTIIVALPTMLGLLVAFWCRLRRRRYAVEVVGDAEEALGMLGWRFSWMGRLAGSAARATVRAAVRGAAGAAYVTEHTLQKRYPATPGAVTSHYSSIMLSDDAFVPAPRPHEAGRMRLVVAAALSRPYKGIHVLIDAVSLLQRGGLPVELTVVGDGPLRPSLEAQAAGSTSHGSVRFVGRAAGPRAVREHFDDATVYVQPSLTEGLPRSVIEAMARGLPCIATRVGGMSELLDEGVLVPPGDATALALALRSLLTDQERHNRQAATNLARAAGYRLSVLQARRASFYGRLIAMTQSGAQAAGTEAPRSGR